MSQDLLSLPGFAVAVFGPDATLVKANLAFLKRFRFPSMPYGVSLAELMTGRDRDAADAALRSVFFGHPWPMREYGFLAADGSSFLATPQLVLNQEFSHANEASLLFRSGPNAPKERFDRFQSSILQQLQDGVFVLDMSLKIRYWNALAEQIFQLPAAAATGASVDILPHRQVLKDSISQLVSDVTLRLSGEWELRPDVWMAYEIGGWFDDNSALEGIICICRDISSRKSLEFEVRESEALYRAMFEDSPVAMVIYDTDSFRVLEANASACRFYEYTPAQMKNLSIFDLRPDDEKKRLKEILPEIRESQRQKNIQTGSWIHQTKSGKLVHVDILSHAVSYRNYNARLIAIRDMSAERLRSTRLRESESRLKLIFEHSDDLILMYDQDLKVVLFNKKLEQQLLKSEGTQLQAGMTIEEFMRPPDAAYWRNILEKALLGHTAHIDHKHLNKSGDSVYVSVTIQPLFDDGKTSGVAVFTKDLSQQRRKDFLLENSARMASIGGWELNILSGKLFWTDETFRIHERDPSKPVTLDEALQYYLEADRPTVIREIKLLEETGKPVDFVLRIRTESGKIRYVRALGELETVGTKPVLMKGTFQDVTDSETRRLELQTVKERLDTATSSARIGIWEIVPGASYSSWNKTNFELHGLPVPENLQMPHSFKGGFQENERAKIEAAYVQALLEKTPLEITFSLPVEGETRHFKSIGKPVLDAAGNLERFVGITQDITKEHLALIRQEEALQERELLLSEVHHRVKNNFAVITSLLGLHIGKSTDPELKEVLDESRRRIMSMALVHERLYQNQNFSHVDFDAYLNELVPVIMTGFSSRKDQTTVHMNTGGILLDIVRAIPLGLLVNELISNSMKHAFSGSLFGQIWIDLVQEGNGFRFSYRDDGSGFDYDSLSAAPGTMGLLLIRLLSQQLKGTLTFQKGPGFRLEILVPDIAS